jgi:hypothetical protein
MCIPKFFKIWAYEQSFIVNNKEDDKWSFLEFLSPIPNSSILYHLGLGEPPNLTLVKIKLHNGTKGLQQA